MENLKQLCRLCGKPDVGLKDLVDEENMNILKLVQEFIKIEINMYDCFSSKICIMCEDTILSFNIFLMECHKTQEEFKKSLVDSDFMFNIKIETSNEARVQEIKSEVKPDVSIESAEGGISCDEDVFEDNNESYIPETLYKSTVPVSPLTRGRKTYKFKIIPNDKDKAELEQLIKRPNSKLHDFVKLKCHLCEEEFSKWLQLKEHVSEIHNSRPKIRCLCGEVMISRSIMYKHVSNHKLEGNNSLKLNKTDGQDWSHLKVNDFVNFKCSLCPKNCSSWYVLSRHCMRCHKRPAVVQCACGALLKSKSVVYKHVSDHKNPALIMCNQCPKVTKSEAAMERHKLKHFPGSVVENKCSSCDKKFSSRELLKSHEKSHIPIEDRKIYSCEICNLKFTTRSSAAAHKRVVHFKIKSYVCDLCGYACGTGGELRQHRAIHSDDKPFVCSKCSKSFKTYSNLKSHMDIHGDTAYPCYVCNKVLNSRRTYRKHLLVHQDECKHVCSYCNKAFKRRQTLKVHLHTHTGDKPLVCKWCGEKFSYASTLRSHRLRCHPEKLPNIPQENNFKDATNATNVVNAQQEFVKEEHTLVFQDTEIDNKISLLC